MLSEYLLRSKYLQHIDRKRDTHTRARAQRESETQRDTERETHTQRDKERDREKEATRIDWSKYVPGAQDVQGVAGLRSWSKTPGAHGAHVSLTAGAYLPAVQLTQAEAAAGAREPASQGRQSTDRAPLKRPA